MKNSKISLDGSEKIEEEFNIVLQKRKGHFAEGTPSGVTEIYPRGNNIYS